MRKRIAIILAVCLLIVVIVSLLIWDNTSIKIPQKYQKDISRNVNNAEEEAVLRAAEAINYSSILSKERFKGSTDPDAYLRPDKYLEYTQANFIDSQVIDYYTTRYGNLQGKGDPKQIDFSYSANVTKLSRFRIFDTPTPIGSMQNKTTIVMSAPNGSLISKDGGAYSSMYYKNQTGYHSVDWGYDFNFTDCYVLEMKLSYSETYAPLAAFFVNIDQIVVLDKNLVSVLVGAQSWMAVA